jgi:hypothetical protein
MKLRLTLTLFLSIITSLIYAQEKSVPSGSKIDKVIVFLSGAQIET